MTAPRRTAARMSAQALRRTPRRTFLGIDPVQGAAPPGDGRRGRLAKGVALLAGATLLAFLAVWLLDYYSLGEWRGLPRGGPLDLLFDVDAAVLQDSLAGLAQVIVAVLGIAITVASIVVQLAATRYTSRIADMFFRDRKNLVIMGFFVAACVDAVWVSLTLREAFLPRATIALTTLVATASLLSLIPYFAYVFDFLDPQKVIVRIGQQIQEAAFKGASGADGKGADARDATAPAPSAADIDARQANATAAMEHLGDVAVNAVAQKDKVIASHATAALREVAVNYVQRKAHLPAAWFTLGPEVQESPDFLSLADDSLRALEHDRAWLEWKILRHFRSVFSESLHHLPEMAHVVAIETRYVGEAALAMRDRPVIAVVLKFFNTYLRTALNARDVRAAYNILHQYRQLAESVMREGQDDLAVEIGRYLMYYGQTAHGMDLGFVTETAAFDLSILCERAFDLRAPCHDQLLKTFLEVDKEAETSAEEKALRGVRKAQMKLATYYLQAGAEEHARRIHADMRDENQARLRSIRDELLAVTSRDFWEVTDRGINFDFLDETRKRQLEAFFGWFGPGQQTKMPDSARP